MSEPTRRFRCGRCYASWANVDALINHVWLAELGVLPQCNPHYRGAP